MNRATEIVKREILRTEKNRYILNLFMVIAGYVGVTLWVNSVRQSASDWLLWTLVVIQLLLVLALFVVSSLRLRQCRMPWWWLFIPLVLTRINNLEYVVIAGTIILMAILSERNEYVSAERSHFTSSDEHGDMELEKMKLEATRLQQDLAHLENPETICVFGQMAFDGDGVEQDFVQAAGWFKIAAEKGHARAQHNLALMYESGQGVPQDPAQAAKWYRMAADQGHAGSQNNLGTLYEQGIGVPQDDAIALDFYRKAAQAGDPNAIANARRLEAKMTARGGERRIDEKKSAC
jgi:TPR repeat protein